MSTTTPFRSDATQEFSIPKTLISQISDDSATPQTEAISEQSKNSVTREVKQSPSSAMANQHITSMISVTGGLMLLIGSLWIFVRAWRLIVKEKTNEPAAELYLNAFKSMPCYNCKYFSDNVYVKCAVHPENVLTTHAHQCPDYCSRSEQSDKTNSKGFWGQFSR
jgi:hypothetical protein